jgi:hypothetical protein
MFGHFSAPDCLRYSFDIFSGYATCEVGVDASTGNVLEIKKGRPVFGLIRQQRDQFDTMRWSC